MTQWRDITFDPAPVSDHGCKPRATQEQMWNAIFPDFANPSLRHPEFAHRVARGKNDNHKMHHIEGEFGHSGHGCKGFKDMQHEGMSKEAQEAMKSACEAARDWYAQKALQAVGTGGQNKPTVAAALLMAMRAMERNHPHDQRPIQEKKRDMCEHDHDLYKYFGLDKDRMSEEVTFFLDFQCVVLLGVSRPHDESCFCCNVKAC